MVVLLLLQQAHLLQMCAVALSVFNLIAFLWLTCTVWLNGNRQSVITSVGVVGLGLSAVFFFIHSLLIFSPLDQDAGLLSINSLWHLIWLPAVGVPYIWFVIGLHYAVLMNEEWRQRRPVLLCVSTLLGLCVFGLLIVNRVTFTFRGAIHLLGYSGVFGHVDVHFFSPVIWLPVLFLIYVTFCAIGPWFTPSRMKRLLWVLWSFLIKRRHEGSLRNRLIDAFWTDKVDRRELQEIEFSWHLARPGLLLAALLMVGLTVSLGALGVWAVFHWLTLHQEGMGTVLPAGKLDTIPAELLTLDIYAAGLVALVILLIGYSIVRHGVLIERPLARRGFFEQWRGVVIVATMIAIFISLLVQVTASSLGPLLLITSLAIGIYAMFTWSSYTAHDRYIALLAPFLRSTNVRHWLNTDLRKTEKSMEVLFSHLCKEVLDVRCALLILLSGPVRRRFTYQWSIQDQPIEIIEQEKVHSAHLPAVSKRREKRTQPLETSAPARSGAAYRICITLQGITTIAWVLPLHDELGLVAKLYLGPRQDGGVFTDEDMDLAQACGQRILDTLRDHEAMLAVSALLRRRIGDVKLLGAQQRRVLHDEILPLLHLALLRMEQMRTLTLRQNVENEHIDQSLDDAVASITTAHRQLAAMMRTMSTGAPHRLERDGVMNGIYSMLAQDFQSAFDEVEWLVSEETIKCIDEALPPAIAEMVFVAVQEALRNAARHARGSDIHRHLRLTLTASCQPHLEVIVKDDGVGIASSCSSTSGTGGGLLTHSALLAIVGGNLAVTSEPGQGVTVKIFVPIESLP
jgi:signal transduction histidine kinase